MLQIPCPWCGLRDEIEFRYGGQAHRQYPAHADDLNDDEWADFLFVRDNPKARMVERWVHASGCRRWFVAIRAMNNEFLAAYPPGESPEARS